MMLRKFCYLAAVVVFVFGIQSCNTDDSVQEPSLSSNTSRIQLKLVDAPGDYLEVNVVIIDIQYNSSEDEEGWKSFEPTEGYPIEVDLTELVAGNSLVLADEIIPSGMMKQIRLVLADEGNTIVIDEGEGDEVVPSQPIDLKTPSAQQSGLKLKLEEVLEAGFSYTFILDWDVQKSIVKAGNSGKYNLKPVINVIAEVNSGSLTGNVVGKLDVNDEEPVPFEGIMVEAFSTDELSISKATTYTDANGDFLFQGLAEGDYILKIMKTGYQDYMTPTTDPDETIEINVGEITPLSESIELLLSDSIKGNVVAKLTVEDIEALAIEGVKVELYLKSDMDNSIAEAMTDVYGDFSFQGLASGSYILEIKHEGYQDYVTAMDAEIKVMYGVLNELTDSIELILIE